MTWLELTLEDGETRLINIRHFVYVRSEGKGSYLVGAEHSNSVAVRESKDYIREKMGVLPTTYSTKDDNTDYEGSEEQFSD